MNQNKKTLGIEILTGDAREGFAYTYEVSKENLAEQYKQALSEFEQSKKSPTPYWANCRGS